MMRLAARLPAVPEEASYFMVLYARFDYGAKRCGWIGGGNSLLVDWDKVGHAFGTPFFDHVREARKADYLIEQPPRKLVQGGAKGVVFPRPNPEPLANATRLFQGVAQVRNNLMHGEKPYWSERDQMLVHDATFVLEEAWLWCEQRRMPLAQHMEYSRGGTP